MRPIVGLFTGSKNSGWPSPKIATVTPCYPACRRARVWPVTATGQLKTDWKNVNVCIPQAIHAQLETAARIHGEKVATWLARVAVWNSLGYCAAADRLAALLKQIERYGQPKSGKAPRKRNRS